MKTYPSIPSSWGTSFREFEAHIFDKLDGSNLRFEWNRKQAKKGVEHAWTKQGTRKRLFDETDPLFGPAIPLFHDTLAGPIHDIAKYQRWESVTVFCEYWGEKSFAGWHDPQDAKRLTVFDVCPYKIGQMDPKAFLRLFKRLDIPNYLGKVKWSRGFVQDVRDGKIEGITFEGVVGKSKKEKSGIIMSKAKTQAWIDKVRASKGKSEAERLINS